MIDRVNLMVVAGLHGKHVLPKLQLERIPGELIVINYLRIISQYKVMGKVAVAQKKISKLKALLMGT